MEITMVQPTTSIFSRVSSAFTDRAARRSRSRKHSISPPKRAIISSPPRRYTPEPASFDLASRAVSTVAALYSTHDAFDDDLISPAVIIERDEEPPMTSRLQYRNSWSQLVQTMPDFQLEVAETIVDEAQRKVLVRSEISGLPNGRRKESVDMMTFDENGVLVAAASSWRIMRNELDD